MIMNFSFFVLKTFTIYNATFLSQSHVLKILQNTAESLVHFIGPDILIVTGVFILGALISFFSLLAHVFVMSCVFESIGFYLELMPIVHALLPLSEDAIDVLLGVPSYFASVYFTEQGIEWATKIYTDWVLSLFSEPNNMVVEESLEVAKKMPKVITSPHTDTIVSWTPLAFTGAMVGGTIYLVVVYLKSIS